MTTATAPTTFDFTNTRPVAFGRLAMVELRKMTDTRAGRWLLIATAAVTAVVLVVQLWVAAVQDLPLSLRAFMVGMNSPMGVFLPVLGILSVTSEWGQRTTLVTFTQVPSRSRVIAAKLAATLGLAFGAVAVGLALATLANAAFGAVTGNDTVWDVDAVGLVNYLLLHGIGLALGFALGMLLVNTAAAVVVYFVYSFVLPGLFTLGAALVEWLRDVQPWLDFAFAQTPLVQGALTGEEWAHLAVAGAVWLVLPFLVGLWRVLRAEVK